jgi:hypothetical protein
MTKQDDFDAKGWVKFPVDPALTDWVQAVAPQAEEIARDAEHGSPVSTCWVTRPTARSGMARR